MLASGHARAEPRFPALLQEVVGTPCAPSCLACHKTDPGDATNWSKPLAIYLVGHGVTNASADSAVKAALQQYVTDAATDASLTPPNTTKSDTLKALRDGQDLESGANLCAGPTYGCGAHIASKAPPHNLTGASWAIAAIVLGGLLRRRRSSSR